MDITMPAGTLGVCTVEWVDDGGNPAPVDGPTQWTSTDETIVQVVTQPGGGGGTPTPGNPLICNVYTPGPIGTAQVQATADADMSATVKQITYVFNFNVISGQATMGKGDFQQGPSGPPSPGGGGTDQAKPKK